MRGFLQDSIDLSHKGHPDIDGRLRDGAAELEHRQYYRQRDICNPAYLEIIRHVISGVSRASKERCIIICR